jgi:glutathione peroxidase
MDVAKTARKVLAVICGVMMVAAVGRSAPAEKTVYDYSLVTFDNKEVSLSTFKGNVLLIVNLARQSIFRDQFALLEELQKTYKDKGLVVIGIPSNDFGAQEPGTEAEIQKVYSNDLHLSFPIFARASVRGKDEAPLYEFLTSGKGPTAGQVHWSYTKFVIDRAGKVVARFEPQVAPNSAELQVTIEDVLAGKFKPPAPKGAAEDEKKETTESDEDPGR